MGKIQRNSEIVQTLDNITGQTTGIGHDLNAGKYLCAFQRHAACHDQADITRSEDDDTLTDQITFHIQITLSGTRSEHTGGAGAGNCDCAACSFAASHRQNDGAGLQYLIAAGRRDDMYVLLI